VEAKLEFWAEDLCRKVVEPYLNERFDASELVSFDLKLRYIPIIMRPDWAVRYPSRSKARISQRVYDCSPQLAFLPFVFGTPEEQLQEYLRGIEPSGAHLAKFGATIDQVAAFAQIMMEAHAGLAKRMRREPVGL
jgi:hypothetical protein